MSDYPTNSTEGMPLFEATAEPPWEAAQRGIDQAERNANLDWKEAAIECVRTVARRYREFTTDEVLVELDKLPEKTHNLSALGAVMRRADREGLIANTGQMRQTKIARRHRKLTVWRSKLVGEYEA